MLCFSRRSLINVQGIKDPTSQTQGPDGTLYATTLNSVKTILEGLSRKTKVMELNPNFIQHVDVEILLTLFVENFFPSMRGGDNGYSHNARLVLVLSQMYHRITETFQRYKLQVLFKSSGLLLPSAYFRRC